MEGGCLMSMLPDHVHQRALDKALSLVTDEWVILSKVIIQTLPSSVMAEIIGDLQRTGKVDLRKANGTIEIRRVKATVPG